MSATCPNSPKQLLGLAPVCGISDVRTAWPTVHGYLVTSGGWRKCPDRPPRHLGMKPPGVSRAMGPAHKGVCRSVGQLFSVLTGYCPVFVSSFFSMFSFFLFFLAFLYFICYFNFSHFNYF